jgi:hypothetical protein
MLEGKEPKFLLNPFKVHALLAGSLLLVVIELQIFLRRKVGLQLGYRILP